MYRTHAEGNAAPACGEGSKKKTVTAMDIVKGGLDLDSCGYYVQLCQLPCCCHKKGEFFL